MAGFEAQLKTLKNYGKDLTKSQWTFIPTTFVDVVQGCCRSLQRLHDEGKFQKLTFENHWAPNATALIDNCARAFDAVDDVIRNDDKLEGFIVESQGVKRRYDQFAEGAKAAAISSTEIVKEPSVYPPKYTKSFAVLMSLARLVAPFGMKAAGSINRFFSSPSPSVPQRNRLHNTVRFHEMKWLLSFFFPVYVSVANRIEDRVIMELGLLRVIRGLSAEDNERMQVENKNGVNVGLKKALSNDDGARRKGPVDLQPLSQLFTRDENRPDVVEKLMTTIKQKKKININNLRLQSSKVIEKLRLSLMQILLLDMVETVNKYGYNPHIAFPDGTNLFLMGYLE